MTQVFLTRLHPGRTWIRPRTWSGHLPPSCPLADPKRTRKTRARSTWTKKPTQKALLVSPSWPSEMKPYVKSLGSRLALKAIAGWEIGRRFLKQPLMIIHWTIVKRNPTRWSRANSRESKCKTTNSSKANTKSSKAMLTRFRRGPGL